MKDTSNLHENEPNGEKASMEWNGKFFSIFKQFSLSNIFGNSTEKTGEDAQEEENDNGKKDN